MSVYAQFLSTSSAWSMLHINVFPRVKMCSSLQVTIRGSKHQTALEFGGYHRKVSLMITIWEVPPLNVHKLWFMNPGLTFQVIPGIAMSSGIPGVAVSAASTAPGPVPFARAKWRPFAWDVKIPPAASNPWGWREGRWTTWMCCLVENVGMGWVHGKAIWTYHKIPQYPNTLLLRFACGKPGKGMEGAEKH